jgi:hypothetical protein
MNFIFFLKNGSSYKKLHKGLIIYIYIIFTCMSDYRRGLDCRLDLLTTLKHDSWLRLIIAPSLNPTFNISLQHVLSLLACCIFTSSSLVTASNNGDPSASALTSLPASSQLHRLKSSLHRPPSLLLTDWFSTDSLQGWRPFHTNLIVFASQAH